MRMLPLASTSVLLSVLHVCIAVSGHAVEAMHPCTYSAGPTYDVGQQLLFT